MMKYSGMKIKMQYFDQKPSSAEAELLYKKFIQEDESREEVREKKKHKNHKGRDDE